MRTIKKFWEIKAAKNDAKAGEIYIYSEISSTQFWGDEVTAQTFKADLDELGDVSTLNVYINSPGGSVFEGNSIYNIIKRHKAHVNVYVDGLAASIASVIAMSGDVIFMPANAMMMIHNPWTLAQGNADELRKQADDMDRIRESLVEAYLGKAGEKLDRDRLIALLDAETWLTAQECLELGLCDSIEAPKQVAAKVDTKLFASYRNTPDALLNQTQDDEKQAERERLFREQLIAEAETSLLKLKNDGGII
ncbi:Clp protease ClpP [Bacillus amyloliquefaciens]|uniref:head maturation protease, ClpP-related n=1 Tax=Bacillus amyloliquefaciens group TaxID=1938374 RepID=UPI0014196726|nr:Clp protease ClpP [Bacillus velezensis]NIG99948.1 Clp protease ClpP [Bacillus amyloliquefaciens]